MLNKTLREMITLDNMKSKEELSYIEAHEEVNSYQEGEKAAIDFFRDCGIIGNVQFYGPKVFKDYDEEKNTTVETVVYESYVDPGSVDYFYFSYEREF